MKNICILSVYGKDVILGVKLEQVSSFSLFCFLSNQERRKITFFTFFRVFLSLFLLLGSILVFTLFCSTFVSRTQPYYYSLPSSYQFRSTRSFSTSPELLPSQFSSSALVFFFCFLLCYFFSFSLNFLFRFRTQLRLFSSQYHSIQNSSTSQT